MIGILLYLTSTRPDILHVVDTIGRFQANPKESHLHEVNRIFKYLQGSQEFGLWYLKDTYLTLHAYLDENLVGNVDDHKSIGGVSFYMGSWILS